jgi:uncharacterized protein YndB with AHSA1/START domain
MRLKLLVAFLGLITLVGSVMFAAGLSQGSFRIERSVDIDAPASAVFSQLGDLQRWPDWHPWLTSNDKKTFGGAANGVGATCEWAHDSLTGKSRITITASQPPERLAVRVEVERRKSSTYQLTFALSPAAKGTRVSAAISGPDTVFSHMFPKTHDMMGKSLEQTLQQLGTATVQATRASADR